MQPTFPTLPINRHFKTPDGSRAYDFLQNTYIKLSGLVSQLRLLYRGNEHTFPNKFLYRLPGYTGDILVCATQPAFHSPQKMDSTDRWRLSNRPNIEPIHFIEERKIECRCIEKGFYCINCSCYGK